MDNPVFTILGIWNIIGGLTMTILTTSLSRYSFPENILNPIWIYNKWRLNYFGVALVCILFNLSCPVWTICVWGVKFLKFICTAGRR